MRYLISLFLFVAINFIVFENASAGGDLLVAPTRVEFEDRERTKIINVVNNGNEEATYRISFKNMSMDADGAYHDITTPQNGEKFADPYLKFSPRSVTLKPGQSQTVRIMLRRQPDMQAGEYRSHLLFTALPPQSSGENVEATPSDQLSIKLIPLMSISIPALVHIGETSHNVKISNAVLNRKDNALSSVDMVLNRTGNSSSFGDIIIMAGSGLNPITVGELKGVAVLEPYPNRKVNVQLTIPENTVVTAPLQVLYYQRKGDQRLTTTYDEIEVQ